MKKKSFALAMVVVVFALLSPESAVAGNPVSDVLKGMTNVVDTIMSGSSRQTAQSNKQKPKQTEEELQLIENIRQQAKRNNENIAKLYLSSEKRVGPDNALDMLKHDLEKKDFACSITRSEKKPENKVLHCLDPTKTIVLMIEVDKTKSQITVKSIDRTLDIEETHTQEFVQHKEATADVVALYSFDLYEKAGFDVSDKARSPEGYLIIKKVAPDSIAAAIPLLPGSEIYKLDGKSTQDMSATEFRVAINFKRHQKESSNMTYMAEDGTQKTATLDLR